MTLGPLRGGLGPLGLSMGSAVAPWWAVTGQTCIAAYCPKGAVDLAASYINLANPGTYNAAPGVAPTLGAAGWGFNSIDQYLTTGIVPGSAGYSLIARFSGVTVDGVLAGEYAAGAFLYFWPKLAALRAYGYGDGAPTIAGAQTSGIMAIAGSTGYLNGVFDTALGAWTATTTLDIWIGALNYAARYYFGGTIAALAIYSTTLSAADVAALSTRMALL